MFWWEEAVNASFFVVIRGKQACSLRAKLHRVDFTIKDMKLRRAGHFHIPGLLLQGLVSMETLSTTLPGHQTQVM